MTSQSAWTWARFICGSLAISTSSGLASSSAPTASKPGALRCRGASPPHRPAEKILSISGDGGFLYSAMELETAVRLKANLVHMVWIDGTYDMVATQERLKYGRASGTDFGPIDYIKYAEAFGATGLMINTPGDVAPMLKKAFDTPGPVI